MNVYYFEKKFNHENVRGNVDVSEDINSGLYSKTSPWLNEIDDQLMHNIDLEQVKLNPMKTVQH